MADDLSETVFRRSVHFEPGYNHLDETGPKARGQHGMGIRFILVGPEGAVTLLMNTGWVPPHPDHAITPRRYSTIEPIVHPQQYRSGELFPTGSHIGFHWATDPDVYTSSIGPERCQYLGNGRQCWFDAGYGMSDPVLGELIKKGDAAVWRALLGHYKHRRDAIAKARKEQGMSESITRHAQDEKAGMTLAELKKTVAQAEAISLPDEARVNAVVGWGGQVKQLTVTTPSTVS